MAACNRFECGNCGTTELQPPLTYDINEPVLIPILSVSSDKGERRLEQQYADGYKSSNPIGLASTRELETWQITLPSMEKYLADRWEKFFLEDLGYTQLLLWAPPDSKGTWRYYQLQRFNRGTPESTYIIGTEIELTRIHNRRPPDLPWQPSDTSAIAADSEPTGAVSPLCRVCVSLRDPYSYRPIFTGFEVTGVVVVSAENGLAFQLTALRSRSRTYEIPPGSVITIRTLNGSQTFVATAIEYLLEFEVKCPPPLVTPPQCNVRVFVNGEERGSVDDPFSVKIGRYEVEYPANPGIINETINLSQGIFTTFDTETTIKVEGRTSLEIPNVQNFSEVAFNFSGTNCTANDRPCTVGLYWNITNSENPRSLPVAIVENVDRIYINDLPFPIRAGAGAGEVLPTSPGDTVLLVREGEELNPRDLGALNLFTAPAGVTSLTLEYAYCEASEGVAPCFVDIFWQEAGSFPFGGFQTFAYQGVGIESIQYNGAENLVSIVADGIVEIPREELGSEIVVVNRDPAETAVIPVPTTLDFVRARFFFRSCPFQPTVTLPDELTFFV